MSRKYEGDSLKYSKNNAVGGNSNSVFYGFFVCISASVIVMMRWCGLLFTYFLVFFPDEDTVDLDLPNVKTRKRPKDDVINDQDNNKTVLNDLTFLRENDDNQNNSDEKENNVTTSSKVAGRNAIPISESSKEQKKNCNSKVEDNNCTEETPVVKVSLFKNKQPKKNCNSKVEDNTEAAVVKVSLFKNKQPKKRRRASGKNAKKGNTKELHYDR